MCSQFGLGFGTLLCHINNNLARIWITFRGEKQKALLCLVMSQNMCDTVSLSLTLSLSHSIARHAHIIGFSSINRAISYARWNISVIHHIHDKMALWCQCFVFLMELFIAKYSRNTFSHFICWFSEWTQSFILRLKNSFGKLFNYEWRFSKHRNDIRVHLRVFLKVSRNGSIFQLFRWIAFHHSALTQCDCKFGKTF